MCLNASVCKECVLWLGREADGGKGNCSIWFEHLGFLTHLRAMKKKHES